ncbi:hypothetical protein C7271_09210 [filamentous cyanobacterium CCP5]|nr:hypothetical protein C7271_09210 [filamentous cyanobacterium CCP5]
MANQIVDEDRLYAAEDAQQILQIAIAQDIESGELSRGQLLEIASELGIAPGTLIQAEKEWQLRKQDMVDQHQFDRFRRERLGRGVMRFAIVALFLVGFKLLIGLWAWLLYLVLGPWALKLVWDAWNIFYPDESSYAQAFERWRRKQQLKQVANRFVRWLSGA